LVKINLIPNANKPIVTIKNRKVAKVVIPIIKVLTVEAILFAIGLLNLTGISA